MENMRFQWWNADRTAFSKFIAEPQTVEGVFRELRSQALKMGVVWQGESEGGHLHLLEA
jgi:hypothetical protein